MHHTAAVPDIEDRKHRCFERLRVYIQDTIARYSPWYRRVFAEVGIDPRAITDPATFARLVPFTSKAELQNAADFILQPAWPGATEPPVTEPIAAELFERYEKEARTLGSDAYTRFVLDWQPQLFTRTGGSTGMGVEIAYTHSDLLGPFSAGAKLHHAIRGWSATQRFMSLSPAGEHLAFFGNMLAPLLQGQPIRPTFGGRVSTTEEQIRLAHRWRAQMIQGNASYVAHWLQAAVAMMEAGDIDGLPSIQTILVAGEPLTDAYRAESQGALARLHATDAIILQGMSSTELKSPGFRECDENSGLHIDAEHYYVEIVDPVTREAVPDGSPGVLVWSHIGWHGTAILRYWSGDLVRGGIRWTSCERCGMSMPRLYPPIRRIDLDFIKVRGTRVDLASLRATLDATVGRDGFQVRVVRRKGDVEPNGIAVVIDGECRVSDEAIRRAIRSAIDLEIESVERCSQQELQSRLYSGGGWKGRWLVQH